MTRPELTTLIEQNLSYISIGDKFSTATKLYKALSIPIDNKSDKKTIRSVISLYVKWEKTGSLNRNGKTSNEIIVTDIIPEPEYVDGRTNNKGGNNSIYSDIIKSALLHYKEYPEFITRKDIFCKIFGFKAQDILATEDESESVEAKDDEPNSDITSVKHILQYKGNIFNKLREITQTALDGLQKEGYLSYRKISIILSNVGYLPLINFHLNEQTTLQQFYECIENGDAHLQCLISRLKQYTQCYFSPSMSVIEFIQIITERKEWIQSLDKCIDFPTKSEPEIANDKQNRVIEIVETTVSEHFRWNINDVMLSLQKRIPFYRYTNIIYKLLGWKSVFKAFQIELTNPEKGFEKYPQEYFSHQILTDTLEPYIIRKVNNTFINPYEVEKKRLEKLPHHGYQVSKEPPRGIDPSLPDNINIYYLRDDYAVNRLHCRIFNKSPDNPNKTYFSQFVNSTSEN